MKLLLTSDLHYRPDWYQFLAMQSCDALLIAGDLLDQDFQGGSMLQMLSLRKWCSEYQGMLALCLGNHDATHGYGEYDPIAISNLSDSERQTLMQMLSNTYWMDALFSPTVTTDRRTELMNTAGGELVVTTLPFSFMTNGDPHAHALLEKGARLRASTGAPWIILHHEPPAASKIGGFFGDHWILNGIRKFRPYFVLSGHQHAQPYDGDFAERIDATWCFNPGCPDELAAVTTSIPNHIILDLSSQSATWRATGEGGTFERTIVFYETLFTK